MGGASRLRLAVRGLVFHQNRLLLVNAWPGGQSDLLCAPGGGVEPHQSLPDNLAREIHEETGLTVEVGGAVLVNEFHAPDRAFHQVDIYFRCSLVAGDPFGDWTDPEGVVTERHWVTRDQLHTLHFKPDSLPDVAWDRDGAAAYDPLELLVR
ncbi:MAG: NUDIX hydrolase [Rhodobacteraceae bacterium]|nr:MAG: NUDIX hydrolase [Paracoccaceae bacterium]